jgi:fumarate hydratase subunit alpha
MNKRIIAGAEVTSAVKKLALEASFYLGQDVIKSFEDSRRKEASVSAQALLDQLLENAAIAAAEQIPLCQDCGFAVVFADLGEDATVDGNLKLAIEEGVRQAYKEGYLRKSILRDPLRRENTGDNTPAVVWIDAVPGDKLTLYFEPKGGGSENMSEVRGLKPADGREGVINFVVDRVKRSGGNPCPPVIVGVGIGGTFEKCAQLAKRSLLREIGHRNPDPFYAEMELEILDRLNRLGIGPQGLGGTTTALDVFIDTYASHIASLICAVNIQCHSARHKMAML